MHQFIWEIIFHQSHWLAKLYADKFGKELIESTIQYCDESELLSFTLYEFV